MTEGNGEKVNLKRGPVVIHVRGLHSLVIMGIAMFLVTTFNVFFTLRVDHDRRADDERARREGDRRWCGLMVTLDEAYSAGTPSTDIGRRVAAAISTLRNGLGCGKEEK